MNNEPTDKVVLHESKVFDMSFRGTSNDLSSVKVYTNRSSFQIEKQVSFDSEYEQISSLEYFAGSVLSSILLTLLEQSKKKGSIIEEIEGVLNLSLDNPLSMLGVKGYDVEPCINKTTVTVYLYAELEENELSEFCTMALNHSPVYNTLKRSMELEVNFRRLV
ncbi:OsmC family protein [Bacillus suaedae]|uniref:OsmC family protein n=1 Tax=Halalkalibacter suaedae TaxID=2822140 RepID=A0A940WXT4_9BACI|nr:OsmC family protein [Bacillus suaedae]MBP3952642.1 OsmC family protein [Bacillus suaedae]